MNNRSYQVNGLIAASLIVFGLSLFPRFVEIGRFLPQYAIDENDIVEFGVGFMGGDLNPRWHGYGPLYAYLLGSVYYLQSFFSEQTYDAFVQDVFFNGSSFYYTARFINSLVIVAIAGVSFLFARRHFGIRTASITLLLLAFPFIDRLVAFSIRVDVLLGLWSLLLVSMSTRLTETNALRYYVWSGLFTGLGLATKPLTGLLGLPVILGAHLIAVFRSVDQKEDVGDALETSHSSGIPLMARKLMSVFGSRQFYSRLFLFVGSVVMANAIANPYSIMDFSSFVAQQKEQYQANAAMPQVTGADFAMLFKPLGAPFVLTGLLALLYGAWTALRQRNPARLVGVILPVTYVATFWNEPVRPHFYVPVIPIVAVYIGVLLDDLCIRAEKRGHGNSKISALLAVCILCLVLLPGISQVNRTLKLALFSDDVQSHTCLASKNWIENNLPAGSSVLLLGYAASLPKLVDPDDIRQANIGEYFMYYRKHSPFLSYHFRQAHSKYVSLGRPTFRLENIRKLSQHDKDRLSLYCRARGIQYVVSQYHLGEVGGFAVERAFLRATQPFGPELWVYKVVI